MLAEPLEGIGRYAYELIKHMAHAHPETEFHLIFDRAVPAYSLGANVKYHRVGIPARHPWLWHLWFEYSFKKKVQELKPGIIFSPEPYMSLSIDIPSIITCHDLAYIHYPDFNKKRHLKYLRNQFPKFHNAAVHIIAVSDFTKQDLIKQLDIEEKKVSVVHHGVSPEFRPYSEKEIADFRSGHNLVFHYFLYVGALHPRKNIVNLINAFEQFKQENKTDHKLILAGRLAWQYQVITRTINQSPYRRDILHLGFFTGDVAGLINAAEAMCYISLFEGFGMPVLEAMACGTAVICSEKSAMSEVAGEAAIKVDPKDIMSIDHAMKSITNEEEVKNSLIAKGMNRANQFDWTDSAEKAHSILEEYKQ